MSPTPIRPIHKIDFGNVKHPKVTIVGRLHAGLAGLRDMVPNDVPAAETGHVSDPTGTVFCPIVVKDELDFEWRSIRRKEFHLVCVCV